MLLFIGSLNSALNLAISGTPVTWNLKVTNSVIVC